jgi:ubiquinone/menaquinone biosynthesis C-methylase UbiE
VGPEGRVVAVDLRRQSLAFLWIRAVLGGDRNLRIVRGRVDNPELPSGPFDAVLIANTYHELTEPASILGALFKSMRPGARMVVVDRGPPDSAEPPSATAEHHVSAAFAEGQIHQQGFQTVSRDDHFIDRPGNDNLWWLIVFRRP